MRITWIIFHLLAKNPWKLIIHSIGLGYEHCTSIRPDKPFMYVFKKCKRYSTCAYPKLQGRIEFNWLKKSGGPQSSIINKIHKLDAFYITDNSWTSPRYTSRNMHRRKDANGLGLSYWVIFFPELKAQEKAQWMTAAVARCRTVSLWYQTHREQDALIHI